MIRNVLFACAAGLVLAACASQAPTAELPPPPPPPPPPPMMAVAPPAPTAAAPMLTFDPDTVQAGPLDNGKMWTFDNPPLVYLDTTYGFKPDAAWFEKARLSALRLPNCSASFVSAQGLILTNHHCVRESVTAVQREGEMLNDVGFYAATNADERKVPDLYVDQLIEIVDVTAEVNAAAADAGDDDQARSQAREAATEAIKERLTGERGGESMGVSVEVISLYAGGQYKAYIFKRYNDIRLVFAPETPLGYFGGDPDNFTYPRFTLDFGLYRAYDENGQPVRPAHHFRWSLDGAQANDLVFVIGNPGSTNRLQTVAELEARRDGYDPTILRFLETREQVYLDYLAAHPDDPKKDEYTNEAFGLGNSRKAFTGILGGLQDPYLMARRAAAERDFRDAIAAQPALQGEYGDVFDRIAANRAQVSELTPQLGVIVGMQPGSSVSPLTLVRALYGNIYAMQQMQGASDEDLAELREGILASDRPAALEVALLAAKLEDLVHYLGADDPTTQAVLAGQSPADRAQALYDATAFKDSTRTAAMLADGSLVSSGDPMLAVVQALFPVLGQFQGQWGALGAEMDELSAKLARARFEVYGTSTPPDATFSLRFSDGRVQGYAYNGTEAPPFTTFYGMYDRFESFKRSGSATWWDLPARWQAPPASFDRSTPLNFVSTADIIGGNSGSPVVNKNLEVVGVAFDGNIESLPGEFIYLDTANRTVSVDARGILEALTDIYRADRLVRELQGR